MQLDHNLNSAVQMQSHHQGS